MIKSALTQNEVSTKTRVQLDLSTSELQRLNWMMDACDMTSRKELFNNAITLLEWAVKEVSEGRKIASFDDEKKERSILTMPILRAAEGHKSRYRSLGTSDENSGIKDRPKLSA